ncbi:lipopolysaccharide biosynthesis protein [Microbacterium sp. VKM Ac-2923]|uniref:lipopolysaccharide biosynthesis protein n=1 Tax=Microbacterium sp. VKM Ac-2923 TaxID=2929476 RepID=UPI001FB27859|nr:lipopolysaccharide biosynthesis protein [Microbacterium sp. VKM Ac-2923]MCJ1706109.1 lipopolysaccharide biosynthesis protein [Microbacterium sp. VKM Ac-2923]
MEPDASPGSRARGATLLLSTQWLRYVLQIVNIVVLARLIGPADFGIVSLGLAIVGIASVLGDFGLSLAALREKDLSQQQKSNLLWLNTAIGAALALVVAAAAVPIATAFDDDRLIAVVLIAAPAYLFRAAVVQFQVELNRTDRFRRLAASELGGDAVGVATAVILALAGSGYVALALQGTVAALVSLVWACAATGWRPSLPRRAPMRRLLVFGVSTLGTHAAHYITTNVDTIVMGAWYSAATVGFYSRAYQLVMLPLQQVAAPLTRILLPRLAAVADDLDALNDALVRAQRLVSHALLAVTGLLVVGGAPLIEVVLGADWLPAMQYLPVLAAGTVFQTIAYGYYWGFAARGRSGALFFSEVVGRVPMVLLILVWAPLTPVGVAWGVVAGQVLIWASGTFVFAPRAGLRVRELLLTAIVPVTVSGLATLGSWGLDTAVLGTLPPVVRLLAVAAAWTLLAGGLLAVCGRRDARLMGETLRSMRPRRPSSAD